MKTVYAFLLGITSVLIIPSAHAGEAKVTWQDPEEYRDIRPADERKQHFQKRLFNTIEKYIERLSTSLPEDVTVDMTFTDVNLAGEVRYNFDLTREIRVIERMYSPELKFDVQVRKAGDLVFKDSVTLKDNGFMLRGSTMSISHRPFSYEKRMLRDWFSRDLNKQLEQWKERQDDVMPSSSVSR